MEKGTRPIPNTGNPLLWVGNNLDRPSDASGGGGGGMGPTGSNSGGANEVMVVDHTSRRDEYGLIIFLPALMLKKYSAKTSTDTNSQLFDIFASYPTNPYKSPGEMVPFFTIAQWKELERQALIYKYMIFSVPVPPHLLYPPLLSSLSSLYNVGYSKNGAALEAGRCKRTDGKKWRCSRDVAPHQKYCERHLYRGHPRSRKPVEEVNNENNGDVKNHKKSRLEKNPRQFTSANDDHPLLLFNATTDLNSISTNRDLGLMMESEMATNNGADQKWHRFLEPNSEFADEGSSVYRSSAISRQDYNVDQHPLDHVLSYSNLSVDVASGFIDNTNNDNVNVESSLSSDRENLRTWLDRSTAMAGGNHVLGGEMGNVRMRDGVDSYDEDARWLGPICWEPFGPGGPLAEALCGNRTPPHGSVGGPSTTVSSPSGVLQSTLFSHSDGSVCNSPSEIALKRMK